MPIINPLVFIPGTRTLNSTLFHKLSRDFFAHVPCFFPLLGVSQPRALPHSPWSPAAGTHAADPDT